MAGMTALYFHPVALLSFTVPLWISLPVASMLLNQEINYRFAGLWVVFTFILVCGRYILLSWFEEAWRRNQQNQRLISRLDALAHQDPLTKTANRRAIRAGAGKRRGARQTLRGADAGCRLLQTV